MFRPLLRAAFRPWAAFRREEAPLGPALLRMLAWRLPFAAMGAVWGLRGLNASLEALKRLEGPAAERLLRQFRPEDLRAALGALPVPPAPGPWLLLALPLGLAGAWIHHAVWDHAGLWMLRGLHEKRGIRATLLAEARALEVGAVGAALGLLSHLPTLGPWLAAPLALVGLWFWVLRGFALSAMHGCPAWKGVGATLLHAVLFAGFACGAVLLSAIIAFFMAAGAA